MSTEPVSKDLLFEIVGDDHDFLRELTTQFWIDIDLRLPQLRQATFNFDGPRVQSLAHAIAGAATCVAAKNLREKAVALEECGRSRTVSLAQSLFEAFETELGRVRAFFDEYFNAEAP